MNHRPPEYRKRLLAGVLMALGAVGVLLGDHWLAPWHPFLLVSVLALALRAAWELHRLLGGRDRPPLLPCLGAVALLVLANWPSHLGWTGSPPLPWRDLQAALAIVLMLAFLLEMAYFRRPDGAVSRIALLFFVAGYVGMLPAYFVQLRWWPDAHDGFDMRGSVALAMAMFVPKVGDIGAYLVGKLAGRNRMTPVLSPKKTWEGFAGGLAGSMLAAVVINRLAPVQLLSSDLLAAQLGATVGLAGVAGDLAESLVKRDCEQKDAGDAVPGFGGILDVVDSVLFASPVLYWWLRS